MGKFKKIEGRPNCGICGRPAEEQNVLKNGQHIWRTSKDGSFRCYACHDNTKNQAYLADNYVGNTLNFNNIMNNTMKDKKITASINPSAQSVLKKLKKEYGITQAGMIWNNDLNNYGGVMTRMGLENLQENNLNKKEENRLKLNKKQKEKRQLDKQISDRDKDKTRCAHILSSFEMNEQMQIIEENLQIREERKLKDNPVATGTIEEALEIDG
jgi:hypothetical protein